MNSAYIGSLAVQFSIVLITLSTVLRFLPMIRGDRPAARKYLVTLAMSALVVCTIPATGRTQTPNPFLTAMEHAELAAEAKELAEIRRHLQHVLNCLEGSTGRDYKKVPGNPCTGQGALQSLPKGSADQVRARKAIALARVGVTLHHVPPAHYVAQAVDAILKESKRR